MALLTIQLLALWPVIRWYALRMQDPSDAPAGLLALAAVVICVTRDLREWRKGNRIRGGLKWPTLLMGLYAVTYHSLPPLLRAMIAFTALGATLTAFAGRPKGRWGLYGLIILALPLQASLQFYLGYPLRVMAGTLSMGMLRMSGFAVGLEGNQFLWGTTQVQIDAPCSGTNMLWMALFIATAMAAVYRLGWRQTGLLASMAAGLSIGANACRMSALFVLKTLPMEYPSWLHSLVGQVAFLGASILLIGLLHQLQRRSKWPAGSI